MLSIRSVDDYCGTIRYQLAIGISKYNRDYAQNLRLHYADRDASDLASAIVNTQGSLYGGGIHIPQLTAGRQTPGMEVRFEGTVFASSH